MQVIKRNGEKADFTLVKINDVIMKAFTATQMNYTNDIIDLLALRVTADFQDKVKEDAITATVSAHTEEECSEDMEGLKEEILKSIQDLFQSDFIYKVAISGVKFG